MFDIVGNVARIVTEDATATNYSSTAFAYARNNRTVMFVTGETWEAGRQLDGRAVGLARFAWILHPTGTVPEFSSGQDTQSESTVPSMPAEVVAAAVP